MILMSVLFTATAYSAEKPTLDPACIAWEKGRTELQVSMSATNDQLIENLSKYPDQKSHSFTFMKPETDRQMLTRLTDITECKLFSYFDDFKTLLAKENLSQSQKNKIMNLLWDRIIINHSDDRDTLFSMRLFSVLVEKVVDQKWLKLNDAGYFELSRVLSETDGAFYSSQTFSREVNGKGPEKFNGVEKMSDDEVYSMLQRMRKERQGADRAMHSLVRWVQRVRL